MARLQRRLRLKAPVGEVFAYIADFRTLKDYNPSVLDVRCLDHGPPGNGSRFQLTLSMFGVRIRPVLTIEDIVENTRIVTRVDAFIPAYEEREFYERGHETDLHFTIEFSCAWPLIGPIVDRLALSSFAEKQADTELRLLAKRFGP